MPASWSTQYSTAQAPGLAPLTLWWEFADEGKLPAPLSSNYALTALLPLAMHKGLDLHVAGQVDRILLDNLEEAVAAWTLWRPDLFQHIRLSADQISVQAPRPEQPAALMYSGGVDANFALVAHKEALLGHRQRLIDTAVLVHGFDIPLQDATWFETAFRHALPVLQQFDCQLLRVRTNWREVDVNWEMSHGFGIATVLHQLDGRHGSGFWAADEPYHKEVIPWGNNSISNPLLSAGAHPLRAIGAGYTRSQKIGVIARHDVIRQHLRVCWRQPRNHLNCGICEKCVRTRLALLAHGHDDSAFPGALTPALIEQLHIGNRIQFELMQDVLDIPDSRLPAPLLAALTRRLGDGISPTGRKRRWWPVRVGRSPQ